MNRNSLRRKSHEVRRGIADAYAPVVRNRVIALLLVAMWAVPAWVTANGDGDRLAAQVRTLLTAKCLACHGNDANDIKGEFDLRSREGALRGGESGEPALVPGSPEKSPIFLAVTRANKELAMPPKANDKLSDDEVDLIRRWIAAGAPWPKADANRAEWKDANDGSGVVVHTSGGRSADWDNRRYQPADIWAFQPIRHPPLPDLAAMERSRGQGSDTKDVGPEFRPAIGNAIDVFLWQKRLAAGIKTTAEPADRTTLLRRATFDLTGLPPTPDELARFIEDDSPLAFARLVDRLLTSPRYGEQQARHWLDVVRYADTSGFSNDYERPNAWRYRDYVIRSFNADKPFDQFVVEQLAGDEWRPGDPEMKIAVGFLRMGPWEHTGMTVAAITRQQYLDDVTHHVGVTLLGMGLRCARCHDHKFDPVPTKDYYRIQSCFATTQLAEGDAPFLADEQTNHLEQVEELAKRRHDEAKAVLARLNKQSDDAIEAFLKARGVSKLDQLPADERPKKRSFGLTPDDVSTQKVHDKRQAYFQRETFRSKPYALTVYSGPDNTYQSTNAVNPIPKNLNGKPTPTFILIGGSLATPSDEVVPGVLSAVNVSAESTGIDSISNNISGRRLALAQWITNPHNTLTARVIVNRVWQQHFGTGLVATPNNFGKMGDKPSHPELLDWLATWFVEHGWSIKKLHRLILLSSAYQQSSSPPAMNSASTNRTSEINEWTSIDARNRLLNYFPSRRLAAEEIRDGMLSLSGELNLEMGGPGIFPEIAWEIALQPRHIMGSVAPSYQPSPRPGERNRRTAYAFRYRTLEDPMLEVFNRPGSEISCEQRDATIVATQVFALFNGQSTHRRALALAAQLAGQTSESTDQIRLAFQRVVCRAPTADEISACSDHLQRMVAWHRDHPPERFAPPKSVEREMIEEQTGESFRWTEELDLMNEYVPDLEPASVSPEIRALGDLCLVLLNSNEFLTIR